MTRMLLCLMLISLALAAVRAGADSGGRQRNKLAYGINVVWGVSGGDSDWTRGGMHQKLVDAAVEIGATNTRIGINWNVVEPEPGKYDWSEIDARIDFVRRHGIEVFAIVASTPLWATGLEPEAIALVRDKFPAFIGVLPCSDEHLGDWTKFCAEFAARYKGKISHYEIGNEDDGWPAPIVVRDYAGRPVDVRIGGDPVIYTKRLKAAYRAIKGTDPAAQVSITGLSAGGTTAFLEQIYACGGRDSFDAVAVHPYKERFEDGIDWEWLDQINDLLRHMGDGHRKLWLTEWGYSVDNESPEALARHASAVEQVLLRMERTECIAQASLHTLNDWRSSENDPGSLQRMGLMTHGLEPKPAFDAFRRAARGEAQVRGGFLRETETPVLREPGGGDPTPCPYSQTPPTTDGVLDEWQNAPSVALADRDGAAKATAWMMWDEKFFYLAVETADAVHHQPYGGEWMWRGDSVQIAFDPDRETRKWPRYGYDDVEYGFCLTPLGVEGVRFHGGVRYPNGFVLAADDRPLAAKAGFRAAVKWEMETCVYELAIPWSEITPNGAAAGRKIGLSIAVNDCAPDSARQVYEFGGGIAGEKDPSLFRPVLLESR